MPTDSERLSYALAAEAPRTRKKTLFCVIREEEEFEIKGYHSLKSAKRHEPKNSYVNYATRGDLSRAKIAGKKIPEGVVYSKLGNPVPEQINRRRRRRSRPERTCTTYVNPSIFAAPIATVEQLLSARISAIPADPVITSPNSARPTINSLWEGASGGNDFWLDPVLQIRYMRPRRIL